jgi:hypothetical protein
MDKTRKTTVELHPDAWQRFERAVDVVSKSPPQHRSKAKASRGKSPGTAKRKPQQRREKA